MNNRALVEINLDYCPSNAIRAEQFGLKMRAFMRSGDRNLLPEGVTFIAMRHDSDPEFKLVGAAGKPAGEGERK